MVLSAKQRDDLHRAIADYLRTSGFEQSLQSFLHETDIESEMSGPQPCAGLLEKKWTSVVRLQKKVTELESRIAEMERESATDVQLATRKTGQAPSEVIPRPPALHTMSGHRAAVTRIICHPIFPGTCVSSSEDASIKIWDMETGRFERSLTGHTDAVQDIAFSPSDGSKAGAASTGRILASCSADLTVKLWEFETKFVCLRTLHGHDHNVSSIAFVSSDLLVSVSRDKSLKLWNVSSGFCLYTLAQAHDEWIRMVRLIALTPKSASYGSNGGDVGNLSTTNGDINSNTIGLSGNANSRTNVMLATCSNDHSIKVWSLDSSLMASSGSGGATANAALTTTSVKQPVGLANDLRAHSHVVECIVWAPHPESTALALNASDAADSGPVGADLTSRRLWTGPFLASGSRDRTIIVWDVTHSSPVMTLAGHDNWVRGLTFHPSSGKLLLSASDDKTLRIWDLRHKRCLKTLSGAHDHFITTLDFHCKSPFVVSASVDQTIKVWECR